MRLPSLLLHLHLHHLLLLLPLLLTPPLVNADPIGLAPAPAPAQDQDQARQRRWGKREVQLGGELLDKVRQLAISTSTKSWENGTLAQALIEFDNPSFSPFNTSHTPLPTTPSLRSSVPESILSLARVTLENRPTDQNAATLNDPFAGGRLLEDGSSADPASLGVAVYLMGESEAAGGNVIGGVNGSVAAREEVEYQLYNVPRTPEGAISHRVETAQLWADFIYMVPPFLAYYGFSTSNQTLLQIAYDQCRLYRAALQDPETKLWRHIAGGEGNGISDAGLWATGNGWASSGMLRVAATIQRSEFGDDMRAQVDDLAGWTGEIVAAAKERTTSSGLVRNYMTTPSSFPDTAGSTMLAYSAFRLSTMGFTSDHTGFANQIHSTVIQRHLADNGTLTDAVDPLVWDRLGPEGSPEGQSFVLLMQAAYNEYRATGGSDDTSGKDEDNAAARSLASRMTAWMAVGVAGMVALAGARSV